MMKFLLPVFLSCGLTAGHALELPLRINAGGPAIGKPGDDDFWAAGKTYVKGGANYKFGGKHDRSKVTDPGPNKIYETVRHQPHRYEIKDLPPGNYRVRFHFTDGMKTNTRAMDYKINGKLVIDNLNIYKTTKKVKRVHIIDTATIVKKGQTLVIEGIRDRGDDVFEAGLEIFAIGKKEAIRSSSRTMPAIATPISKAVASSDIRKFTGGPARFVWLQGRAWRSYTNSKSRVTLMGLDTEDGHGERKILPDDRAFSKPIFTPGGDQIVFTDLAKNRIYAVDWNGKNQRQLGDGIASDVWRDPKTKVDWVYVRKGRGTKTTIVRRRVDKPNADEPVWTRTENGHNGVPWFQLSGDGRMFSDAFPWPSCGVGDLVKNSWKQYERGCWPGVSPDNSYRAFVFSGSHTEINLFDRGGKNHRTIAVNSMRGVRKKKVYFPRWSNDPRFITVVGPEKDAKAELYVGKFDADFQKIEGWARVTKNSRTELFGDAWFGNAPKAKARTVTFVPLPIDDEPKAKGPWPGSKKGLVWMWENLKSQNEANDFVCGGDLHGRARFGQFNDLLLDYGWFSAKKEASDRIVKSVQKTGEFTIEALVTSFSIKQSGPARVVSFSKNSSERNFTIGQEGGFFVLRVRTNAGDGNGMKRELKLCKVATNKAQHLMVTYDGDVLRCFSDGKLMLEKTNVSIDFGSWDPSMNLVFGDEIGGGRDWKGRVEGVAIFNRGMSVKAANQQFQLAHERIKKRRVATPIVLSAKLLEITKTPTREAMGAYRSALVENVYEVQKVISGKLDSKLIIVRQWVVMDGKPLDFIAQKKPGLITELTLEPIENHPQLEGEFRSSDHEHISPLVLLDVNSHIR